MWMKFMNSLKHKTSAKPFKKNNSDSNQHIFKDQIPPKVWAVSYETLKRISIFIYALADFLSFIPFLTTSFHAFLGQLLGKLALTLKVLRLLGQVFSSILSR